MHTSRRQPSKRHRRTTWTGLIVRLALIVASVTFSEGECRSNNYYVFVPLRLREDRVPSGFFSRSGNSPKIPSNECRLNNYTCPRSAPKGIASLLFLFPGRKIRRKLRLMSVDRTTIMCSSPFGSERIASLLFLSPGREIRRIPTPSDFHP